VDYLIQVVLVEGKITVAQRVPLMGSESQRSLGW
jgi:hypothetical protein